MNKIIILSISLIVLIVGSVVFLAMLGILEIDLPAFNFPSIGKMVDDGVIENNIANSLSQENFAYEISVDVKNENLTILSFLDEGKIEKNDQIIKHSDVFIFSLKDGNEVASGEARFIGDSSFVKVDKYNDEGTLPFGVPSLGKWIKASGMAEDINDIVGSNSPDFLNKFSNFLKDKVLFKVQKSIGSKRIEGVWAKGFLVEVDKEAFKTMLPGMFPIFSYIIGFSDSEAEQMKDTVLKDIEGLMDDFWEENGPVSLKFWLADGKVVRMSLNQSIKDFFDSGQLFFSLEVTLSSFNEQFNIEAPEIDQQYQDFLLFGAQNSRIMAAVAQARTVMVITHSEDGNYDNLNCLNDELKPLCEDVADNSSSVLRTSHAPSIDSNSACLWSELHVVNSSNGTPFYCADSNGRAGATFTNPAGSQYCGNSQEVNCPNDLNNTSISDI